MIPTYRPEVRQLTGSGAFGAYGSPIRWTLERVGHVGRVMTVNRPPNAGGPAVPAGLTSVEAARRRAETGPNTVPEPPPPRLLGRILTQLRDPLILVLLAAMVVTVALRDLTDLAVIALVIVLNTTVGVIQEVRADRAVAALRRLAAPQARVRRDGREVVVPSAELVPGDVVELAGGDIVPADVRLVSAFQFRVDESALTGESVPVDKHAGGAGDTGTGLAGTVVVAGRGTAVVERTGADSALGRITALVAAEPMPRTPLQRRLAGLGRLLGIAAAALSAIVLVAGLLRGQPLAEMVLVAVSLTVAAVPESLPAVVTVALALGARRMARRHAIVRRLPAVETLGSVTVVATDKTGTLTEGQMTCDQIVTADGTLHLAGTGYHPVGTVTDDAGSPGDVTAAAIQLARAMVLCNDSSIAAPAGDRTRWEAVGDPMEAALVTAAGRLGVSAAERAAYPRVAEVPFDATRRRMTTVHATPDGDFLVVCKGAPEAVLPAARPADGAFAEWLRADAYQLARAGHRVLAVATATSPTQPEPGDVDGSLRPLGLAVLTDPPRPGARDVVRQFTDAGVRLILITGDHPATAAAIATGLGVPAAGRTVTGADIAADPDAMTRATVFARTRPEQKMAIVGALQRAGQVVAMTGDGVNDAPALRRADIGVAMGGSGTEAARQAADLVLADDDLATVGAAVAEGRRIYANIRRFLTYALSGGFAEVAIMIAGPFLGFAVPLRPAQILWVNMLTHGLPGVALGAEPADRGVLRDPPRPPREALLGGQLIAAIVATGSVITVVALAAARYAEATGAPWQSVLFTVLGLGQLGVALAIRSRRDRATSRPNRGLDAAVALSAVLQVAAVTVGPLRELLGTDALSPGQLAGCAAIAAVPGLLVALYRGLRRWREGHRGVPPSRVRASS